jgi:hypothetical protein
VRHAECRLSNALRAPRTFFADVARFSYPDERFRCQVEVVKAFVYGGNQIIDIINILNTANSPFNLVPLFSSALSLHRI